MLAEPLKSLEERREDAPSRREFLEKEKARRSKKAKKKKITILFKIITRIK